MEKKIAFQGFNGADSLSRSQMKNVLGVTLSLLPHARKASSPAAVQVVVRQCQAASQP